MQSSDEIRESIGRSVIAVPPLARNDDGEISETENRKLIQHIENGGVNILLYGGNAVFYHLRPSEYDAVLAMLERCVSPDTSVVPSLGPSFGLMMDQALILKNRDFPTAMVLPQRDVTDSNGIVRGIRAVTAVLEKPIVLYLKFENSLSTAAVRSLYEEGLISWIKYAVVRDDPRDDDELRRLVDAVPAQIIISGIGEQPAIIHMRDFGLRGFTSGCVCIAPSRSMEMFRAIQNEDYESAEAIREHFRPLEDLRNKISPIRVLHSAVAAAGISRTGPIQPLLGPLTEDELTRVTIAADKLLSWERAQ